MRWGPLARTEWYTILTAKGLWALVVVAVVIGYQPTYTGYDAIGPTITAGFLQEATALLLPLGVFLLSYRSIVADRTSGSLQFLVGLPMTRTDILLGKIVGRAAGVAVGFLVAATVLALLGLYRFGPFSPTVFLGVLVLTLLYILILVSIATSVSAVAQSHVRATGLVFGVFYLGLTVLWDVLARTTYSAITGTSVDPFNAPAEGPLFLLERLSPQGAYRVATNWLLDTGNSAAGYEAVLVQLQPDHRINALVVESTFPADAVPLYLHEAVSLVILLLWLVVPVGIARILFERGDL